MGYTTEFNWVLKLTKEQGLDEKVLKAGESYTFNKTGERTYPSEKYPIDLLNDAVEAVAKVVITKRVLENSIVSGQYKVLRIYEGAEKEILTKYWQENMQYIKGQKIDDFKGQKFS